MLIKLLVATVVAIGTSAFVCLGAIKTAGTRLENSPNGVSSGVSKSSVSTPSPEVKVT